jgi:serine/threonine protein phosphatase PrpC
LRTPAVLLFRGAKQSSRSNNNKYTTGTAPKLITQYFDVSNRRIAQSTTDHQQNHHQQLVPLFDTTTGATCSRNQDTTTTPVNQQTSYSLESQNPNDNPHNIVSSSSSSSSQQQQYTLLQPPNTDTDMPPHAGMVLTVVTPPHVQYQLLETMNYQFGEEETYQYNVDYAYRPVVYHPPSPSLDDERQQQPVESDEQSSKMLVVETSHHTKKQWWWQWWPIDKPSRSSTSSSQQQEHDENSLYYDDYEMNDKAFTGGSHGEVWRGRRRHANNNNNDKENIRSGGGGAFLKNETDSLIFKRLKIERGYRILEAGLREVHFGVWLAQQAPEIGSHYTQYVDHFFRTLDADGELELWIVFEDAGPSLRSYLYTGVYVGDFVFYQPSDLWTRIRMSVPRPLGQDKSLESAGALDVSKMGRKIMTSVLRQILEAAAFLHENGIVHRDIKPSNVMCRTNLNPDDMHTMELDSISIHCVLGDLSSAWDNYSRDVLYTGGPSRLEQTDEYAPPEAIFGHTYRASTMRIEPTFDSWSIGVLALELLMGTPNVFSVDQRTTAILTQKLKREGASDDDVQRALYLAALSQFCIFNPSQHHAWPLRRGDPLRHYAMVKSKCTLRDFHRGLLARDPLNLGFDSSTDTLLHLIWQLLSWDPKERITASQALQHPYFVQAETVFDNDVTLLSSNNEKALESQMLDPRMDFNMSDSVTEFRCPKCGRVFDDWNSCLQHGTSRKHTQLCSYDRQSLPTCLHAHPMLPVHNLSGYCDIQGRRPTIEDFHSIHLTNETFYYGIFDGHNGNLASKYVASFLFEKLDSRLRPLLLQSSQNNIDDDDDDDDKSALPIDWKSQVETLVEEAFVEIHNAFLQVLSSPHTSSKTNTMIMDQSGTTATVVWMTSEAVILASLGDSRAVLASLSIPTTHPSNTTTTTAAPRIPVVRAIQQLTKDHVASDPTERRLVESLGGKVTVHNSNAVHRVNGTLAITRSIGDQRLSPYLSRQPQVLSWSREEVTRNLCSGSGSGGDDNDNKDTTTKSCCIIILASDGLWDVMSNEDAVNIVSHVMMMNENEEEENAEEDKLLHTTTTTTDSGSCKRLQKAAEYLTLEAYVRGSRDNIGVAVVAL